MKLIRILPLILALTILQIAFAQKNANLWLRNTAISPNGSQIAFTYNADIYAVSVDGGKATRLTTNSAYDTKPVWSHDGQQIAFASNRHGNFDVFVMSKTGSNVKRLTFHSADDMPTDFSQNNDAVWFNSIRLDTNKSLLFHRLGELYSASLNGSTPEQLTSYPAYEAKNTSNGGILFEEIKGYEDEWRKHHTSSVTRDIWLKSSTGSFQKLSNFKGENRNAVFGSGDSFYYLSEKSGTFNVYVSNFSNPSQSTQVSNFDMHPVRHLSVSNTDLLCYSFNGNVYTQKVGERPKKLAIDVGGDQSLLDNELLFVNGNVTDMVPSPNGKELIFIHRGDVFVTSVDGSLTRRLTETPEQERSIDISPDGRTIVYAGERNNSWNLYTQTIAEKNEKYFVNAIELKEEILLADAKESFQPKFSPTGEDIAYLEERTKLRTINLKTKKVTQIHEGENHFSYADGDQQFEWSPDGKWLAITFYPNQYWFGEIGILKADGTGSLVNVSKSGFSDYSPKWSLDGSMIYWASDRNGMHSVAKTGPSQSDVYAVFLTQEAYDKYQLNKDEFSFVVDDKDDEDKKEDDNDSKNDKKKKDEDAEKEEKKLKPITIEFDNLHKRKEKLSLFSTSLSDALITKDAKSLLYLGRIDNKANLWKLDLRTKEIKSLGTYGRGGSMSFGKDAKEVFILSGGRISKVEVSSGKKKPVAIKDEMSFNLSHERLYLMDHVSRQVKKKFLDPNLHGAPWDELSANYKKFVPHLNNDYDFKDILGELLGELNASHTGARFRQANAKGDQTAALGIFIDDNHKGNGLKILEIMEGSPLINGSKKVVSGVIIEAIDGESITPDLNYFALLNRKSAKATILSYYNPATNTRWKERVKPISIGAENELRYQRWVKKNRDLVHTLSNNQIGYMHIRNMSDGSFREFLDEVMGEEVNKKALVVDTRFNGGGDLVDDITTFLSGKKYMEFSNGGKVVGIESQRRWTKPSIMLVGESNYSDAHCTPAGYKDLKIGKLVGMPVPGTCSFVWWERIQNGIVFGIPNMQVLDIEGDVLENKELLPDIEVKNGFEKITSGQDEQIEAAVKELLKSMD
ncbi:C-terminal processing protease CtpA/Prc, contains a PDZ domain [Formosa sp. Hel1_31_208]|uniref:S41 family peptidase n=1 Tax=Formosa sp. Hel1_31_208 TaxID=1798225 RepID=UPI00087D0C3D|nr:S41 family peptidase [Formosa sp. Hel1_31_208]SDS48371.1 C-terminal processing protease CtpA/Prc, contains a PDZ domain [Formosa sp. Hel1_31_208]